jgi:putative phosphoribosyl transferase
MHLSTTTPFADRLEAGRELAGRLGLYARRSDVVVLGLPRGGVPVAAAVADALEAPLDVFLVRKLGVPSHPELAMGAIASGGVRVLNAEVIEWYGITQETLDRVARTEQAELERRERDYRQGRPALDVRDRTVILVDDGLATGSSMRAAVEAMRQRGPSAVVVAVPVGAPSTCAELGRLADEAICARTPERFSAVGQWYLDFSQTSDAEVRRLLDERQRPEVH